MALKRAMDSWTSSLRPYKPPRATTATCGSVSPATTVRRKRSLGRCSLTGVFVETPKKSRLDIKRTSIEKGSMGRALLGTRIKTPTPMKTKATQRRTLIPVYQKTAAERRSLPTPIEDICERLRKLELKVEQNTQLAQNRIKELVEKNDALVEETDRLRILLEDKMDEIWELKEDGNEVAKKLDDKTLEVEQLKARLDDRLKSFRDLERKYRTLGVKFAIAKKIGESRDSESQTLRNLLDIEQNNFKVADGKLTSAATDNSLSLQSRWLKSQAKLSEVHNELERLILSALKGDDVCIFDCGLERTRKRHALEGGSPRPSHEGVGEDSKIEIVTMAFMKALELVEAQGDSGYEFNITASFMEIHNEVTYDLLDDSISCGVRCSSDQNRRVSALGENVGAVQVTSTEQIHKLMERAQRHILVNVAENDGRSPKSHRIYRMQITSQNRETRLIRIGSLDFVDPAASASSRGSLVEGSQSS